LRKLRPINTFSEGDKIQGFYLCLEKNLKYKRNGEVYIDLELRDVTGFIPAKIWDNVSTLNKKFDSGNAVAVSGVVEIFLDQPQLIIKKINKATVQHYGRYGFDPSLVVPSSKKNPKKMWTDLQRIIDKIKNEYIKKLVKSIYKSNGKRLAILPGSVKLQYNYRSGLLEHILSMSQVAKKICPLYKVDSDLVLAGILLHGVGKINEISSEYEADFTVDGHLLGTGALSRDIVKEAISKIKNFPRSLSKMIEHMILNCDFDHRLESKMQPSFPEALLVKQIILLDSKMNLMESVLSEDQEVNILTSRHNFFGVPILKKNESE
jgi:3'-5' exoribonuclease